MTKTQQRLRRDEDQNVMKTNTRRRRINAETGNSVLLLFDLATFRG